MKLLTMIMAVLMAALAMASPLSKSTTNSLNTTLATTPLMSNLTNKVEKPKYDSTWAGAIQKSHGVSEVRGTINVPHANGAFHGNSSYSGRAWIGIDNAEDGGGSCKADVRAGIVWDILGNGTTTYNAFWNFYPGKPLLLDAATFAVQPGDEVEFSIYAKNKYTAELLMKNQRTGGEYSHTIGGFKKQKDKLCLKQALWIMEDPSLGSFEPGITWQKAATKYKGNEANGWDDIMWNAQTSSVEVIDLVNNGWPLTSCELYKEVNKENEAGIRCGCNCMPQGR